MALEMNAQGYYDNRYWTMWKLPMFGCTDPSSVLTEISRCTKAFPQAYIRLVSRSPLRRSLSRRELDREGQYSCELTIEQASTQQQRQSAHELEQRVQAACPAALGAHRRSPAAVSLGLS